MRIEELRASGRILLAGVTIFASGCFFDKEPEASNNSNSYVAENGLPNSVANFLYPELNQRPDLKTKSFYFFDTELGEASIFNFTDFKLNKDAVLEIYRVVGAYASVSGSFWVAELEEGIITASKQSEVNVITEVIVPDDAPKLFSHAQDDPQGRTIIRSNLAFSYVRLRHLDISEKRIASIEGSTTLAVATEACQQMLEAKIVDQEISPIDDRDLQKAAQEAFCNSFGLFITAGLLGFSDEQYQDLVSTSVFKMPGTGDVLPVLPFSGIDYISKEGTVIKK